MVRNGHLWITFTLAILDLKAESRTQWARLTRHYAANPEISKVVTPQKVRHQAANSTSQAASGTRALTHPENMSPVVLGYLNTSQSNLQEIKNVLRNMIPRTGEGVILQSPRQF